MDRQTKLPLEQRLLLNLNLTSESTAVSPTLQEDCNNEDKDNKDKNEVMKQEKTLLKDDSKSSKNFKSLTEQASLSYLENVKHLESLIGEIKSNTIDRIKAELEDITKQKLILENNVNLIKSNLKLVKSHKKICGGNNVKLLNENDMLLNKGERAYRETYFYEKEMPDLKAEIEQSTWEISHKNEETKYIKNDALELDQEIQMKKAEIIKMNKCISDVKKEKESLRNGVNLLKKHITQLKEKINKQDEKCREFIRDNRLEV